MSTNACEFMSSYLRDRYQWVKIANVNFNGCHCKKEFHKAPDLILFFNIFMNDIFYFIDLCDLANYVDDIH